MAARRIGRRPALICGTGYTGEDGVELLIDPEIATAIWVELLESGIVPCGLGARDTLRLEVCFPLAGNELSTEHDPIEAGLGWCAKEETGFIGAEAIARSRAAGPEQLLGAFQIEGPGIARAGDLGLPRRRGGWGGHLRQLLALASGWDRDGLPRGRAGRAFQRA